MKNLSAKFKALIGLSLLTVGLAACSKDAQKTEHSTNPQISLDTLFVHDGCTMYRFEDGGRDHYFARCGNSADVSTTYTTSCGKNCSVDRDDNIRAEGR